MIARSREVIERSREAFSSGGEEDIDADAASGDEVIARSREAFSSGGEEDIAEDGSVLSNSNGGVFPNNDGGDLESASHSRMDFPFIFWEDVHLEAVPKLATALTAG